MTNTAVLYVCATPIGNLQDISLRALEILSKADVILCEDTRNSKFLLNSHGISYKKLISLHEHNENQVTTDVIKWLESGLTIIQISDAGTPGISDPGSRLCDQVLKLGFKVSPLPGACAYISLLSVSGLTGETLFHGFLPNTKTKRLKILELWQKCNYNVAIYEAPHRIIECLEDIVECLGEERIIVMGRELTKQYETIKKSKAIELLDFVKNDINQQRGEFVLLIAPCQINEIIALTYEQINTLNLLSPHFPPKKVALLTSQIHGGDKHLIYEYLINKK
ncbi:MAG: 16S rRNA (cytidine(1402)-2'-O)-methyltransferase [Neisseriaceae bacterium]